MKDQMAYDFQIVIEEAIMHKNAQTVKHQKGLSCRKITTFVHPIAQYDNRTQ